MGDASVAEAAGDGRFSDMSVLNRIDAATRSRRTGSLDKRDSLNPLASFSELRREDILRHVFGDVGELLDDFSCAVESTVLLHGRMYVTSRFLCFYSNLFGLEKKIRIPYTHITAVAKENTALVIPNAIAITTIRKEYIFRSFWDRDECFKMLKDHIRGHTQNGLGMLDKNSKNSEFSTKRQSEILKVPPDDSNVSVSRDSAPYAFIDCAAGDGDSMPRSESRQRARSDVSSRQRESSSLSLSKFEPSTPESIRNSTSSASSNRKPRTRQRAATSGHVDTSPPRESETRLARSTSAGEGAVSDKEEKASIISSADEFEYMDGTDDDEQDDIVEETAWTEIGKDSRATPVVSQEDGKGEYSQETVLQEINRSALKIQVVKEILPISVQNFAKTFVEDQAEHSWKKFHDKMGDSQLDVTKWSNMHAEMHENLGSGREIKFFKPVNLPGLKETRGVKLQKYQRFGTEGLIVQSSTRLEDVPAADTFTVEDMVAVRKPRQDECKGDLNAHVMVEISFEVNFIKSTFLKYMIESNTNTEMKKWLKQFFTHMKSIVEDNVNRAEQKLESIKTMLDKNAGEDEDENAISEAVARRSIRRLSVKVTDMQVGLRAHIKEAFESWQRVEGRRFFVVCFALLLIVTFTMYWQLRHVQSSLDHLHDSFANLSSELAIVKSLLEEKTRGSRHHR